MNILELVSYLVRAGHRDRVREVVRALQPNEADADLDDLLAAVAFRHQHTGKRISYVDALGYVLASKNGLLFLTGDKAFKGLDNVEFVA